jgi:hypothetical protein
VFLVFLYISLIRQSELKQFIYDLFFLSDYVQVKTLKSLVMKTMRDSFSKETATLYLPLIVASDDPELQSDFCSFIVAKHVALSNDDFPFHEVGKDMLFLIFQRMTCYCHLPVYMFDTDQLGN